MIKYKGFTVRTVPYVDEDYENTKFWYFVMRGDKVAFRAHSLDEIHDWISGK